MFKAIARFRKYLLERRINLVLFYLEQEKAKHQELMTQLVTEVELLETRHAKLIATHGLEVAQ